SHDHYPENHLPIKSGSNSDLRKKESFDFDQKILLSNLTQVVHQICQAGPKLISGYDKIQKSMFQQKFRSLKTLRKFLFDGFLNHPWTGETNQGIGFGKIQIAQHGKRRRNTPGGRISHQGEK